MPKLIEVWQNMPERYYWEFAIDNNTIYIVQSHKAESRIEILTVLPEKPEGIVVAESSDTVNSGQVKGKWLVYLKDKMPSVLRLLFLINSYCVEFGFPYILLVEEGVLTSLYHSFLPPEEESLANAGFDHLNPWFFSQALAVIEIQEEDGWHYGRGGSHFAELCQRKNIIFISVPKKFF